MAAHKWLLSFEADVPDQLGELSVKDRMTVFRAIKALLEADNPTALLDVKKLVEKRFEGLWRQRQGDYRILFAIHSGEMTHQGFIYKGRLHIHAIVHRSKAY